MQRDYELMLIVNPTVTDEEMPEAFERIQRLVTDLSGDVVSADVWGGPGKRRFAYPIESHKDGFYYLLRLRLDSAQTDALERSIRIDERILRHLLVYKGESEGG